MVVTERTAGFRGPQHGYTTFFYGPSRAGRPLRQRLAYAWVCGLVQVEIAARPVSILNQTSPRLFQCVGRAQARNLPSTPEPRSRSMEARLSIIRGVGLARLSITPENCMVVAQITTDRGEKEISVTPSITYRHPHRLLRLRLLILAPLRCTSAGAV